jgi:hypothetical protein
MHGQVQDASDPASTLPKEPTAQQLAAEVQDNPFSALKSPGAVPPGLGTATADHRRPFQRSAWFKNVSVLCRPSRPTAAQSRAEVQRTLASSLSSLFAVPAGFGTETTDHFRPFQCSAVLRITR